MHLDFKNLLHLFVKNSKVDSLVIHLNILKIIFFLHD